MAVFGSSLLTGDNFLAGGQEAVKIGPLIQKSKENHTAAYNLVVEIRDELHVTPEQFKTAISE